MNHDFPMPLKVVETNFTCEVPQSLLVGDDGLQWLLAGTSVFLPPGLFFSLSVRALCPHLLEGKTVPPSSTDPPPPLSPDTQGFSRKPWQGNVVKS